MGEVPFRSLSLMARRCFGDPPKYPGGIDHAGHQTPILYLWCSRFNAVARAKVEAIDMIPPEVHIGDTHVHHESCRLTAGHSKPVE